MSYKYSSNTIPRVQPYLDELNKGPELLDFNHPNPQKLSRWLFEALSLGWKNGDESLIKLKNKYRIRALTDRVRVELRDTPIQIIESKKPDTLTISNVTQLREVIGAVIHHKSASMDFPNAKLEEDELTRLTNWAETIGYSITTLPQLKVYKNGRQITEGNRD